MARAPGIVGIDDAAGKRQGHAEGEQHAQNLFHRSFPVSFAKANARMVSMLLPESASQKGAARPLDKFPEGNSAADRSHRRLKRAAPPFVFPSWPAGPALVLKVDLPP